MLSTLAANHTSFEIDSGTLAATVPHRRWRDPTPRSRRGGLAAARFPAPMGFYEFDAHILACATRDR